MADIFAALRWWIVLLLVGTAAFPLTYMLLPRLADRGYAFTKMVGLLLISYIFWLGGSLGLLGNNIGGIVVGIVGLLLLSGWAIRRHPEMRAWLHAHRSQLLLTELLFLVIFALWAWVRAQHPEIAATEKPMDFAFLNATSRSEIFPPLDPWLSGFAISYYYFGYLMTSVLARLAAVPEAIAFNLGIAWLVAGSAVGAFGLVYNLLHAQSTRRAALMLAVVAAIALPLAGNMQILLEILHANQVGSAEFWQWLDVRDINTPPNADSPPRYDSTGWWWWRSSRVIHEYHLSGRPEEGLEPIVEFPAFSFILGDLHPHVMALPFAFLAIAVALAWWLQSSPYPRGEPWTWEKAMAQSWSQRIHSLLGGVGWPLYLFTAVLLGGLSFLNTWDVLIHLFIVLGAFALAQWRDHGWHKQLLLQTVLVAVLLVLPAIFLYLPFYIGFRSQAGAPYLLPMLMRPTRLAHFLIIFGMPLWVLLILLGTLLWRQRFKHLRQGLITAVSLLAGLFLLMLLLGWLIASSAAGAGRVLALANELNLSLPPRPEGALTAGWGLTAVFAIIPAILQARLQYPLLMLLLAAMVGSITMIWQQLLDKAANAAPESTDDSSEPTMLPFVLLLIGTGALLTLGPEFVYLRDNFGVRLNTIFKFYYQSWLLFGISGLFALGYLWRNVKLPALVAGTGYALLLVAALSFPVLAVRSRAQEYRGAFGAAERLPATLNGLAKMQAFNPDEYDAIMWLRENTVGNPTILEAVGGQYSAYGRISASTGLPTLLGWAGHEYQWRGNSTNEPTVRDPVVRDIYQQANWPNTTALLNEYGVEYIYVGSLELSSYGPQILNKFADRLQVAFQSNTVTIYRWQPD